MKKLVIAALAAGAIAAPAAAAELVVNGGFEHASGLGQGWNYSVSNTLSVETQASSAHSGDAWARFIATEDYAADVLYQNLDTVIGETYTYSFWLAGAASQIAPAHFYATLGSQVIADSSDSTNFDYLHFTGSYLATSTSTEIYFEAYNTLGLYLLDDVSVTGPLAGDGGPRDPGAAVPEPATWAMMLLGFGGMGAVLRRRPRAALRLA